MHRGHLSQWLKTWFTGHPFANAADGQRAYLQETGITAKLPTIRSVMWRVKHPSGQATPATPVAAVATPAAGSNPFTHASPATATPTAEASSPIPPPPQSPAKPPATNGHSQVKTHSKADYYWKPPEYEAVRKMVAADLNVYLVGPASSGKSTLACHVCEELGRPYYAVTFDGEYTTSHLLGAYDLQAQDGASVTCWRDGILPKAMREGRLLIIDEMPDAPGGVLIALHSALEHRGIMLTEHNCEIVEPTPGFGVVATGNSLGRGENTLYPTNNAISQATLDRFEAIVEIAPIPQDEETTILQKKTGIDKKQSGIIARTAAAIRAAASKVESGMELCLGLRRTQAWAMLVMMGLELGEAFQYSCLHGLPPDERRACAEIAQRTIGRDV